MFIRAINEIKEDINEFQKNTNKELNEIRKTIQDMKEEFNKGTDILEKIK
jgi:signal transduction histidine kinase